jgi:hypothetical protein
MGGMALLLPPGGEAVIRDDDNTIWVSLHLRLSLIWF